MTETISGVVTAVIIIIITRVLSKFFSPKLFGTTILVSIAFIYVGFSLKDNSPGFIVLESGIALFFYFLALVGYTRNDLLIGFGIILHGLWDVFHHKGLVLKTDVPLYWPSFCFIVDIIDGLYFLFIFRKQKRNMPGSLKLN